MPVRRCGHQSPDVPEAICTREYCHKLPHSVLKPPGKFTDGDVVLTWTGPGDPEPSKEEHDYAIRTAVYPEGTAPRCS